MTAYFNSKVVYRNEEPYLHVPIPVHYTRNIMYTWVTDQQDLIKLIGYQLLPPKYLSASTMQ